MTPAKRPAGRPSGAAPRGARPPGGSGRAASGPRSGRSAGGGGSSRSGTGRAPQAGPGRAPAKRVSAAAKAVAARAAKSGPRPSKSAPRAATTGSARTGKAAPGRGPRAAPSGRRGAPGTGGPAPRRAADRGLGGDQVEGRQAVRELLLAGRRAVHEVWVAADQDEADVLDDIAELAQSVKVPVRAVGRPKLYAVAKTESPQGVLAKAKPLPEDEYDDLLRRRPGDPAPFLLALDGVTDPGNLGALLRTAECAGVTGVVLPRHRAVHITPTVTKTAAGAVEYLHMTVVGGLPAAITKAQKAGVWVIGLDGGGAETIYDLAVQDEPVMLVLGAEGQGLSRLVRERCDTVAAIPLGGQLSSLNVAAAGALACFEIVRRRHAAG
jgi:23S rRNA (guanosine2251-2'-O)-methyltransferase